MITKKRGDDKYVLVWVNTKDFYSKEMVIDTMDWHYYVRI